MTEAEILALTARQMLEKAYGEGYGAESMSQRISTCNQISFQGALPVKSATRVAGIWKRACELVHSHNSDSGPQVEQQWNRDIDWMLTTFRGIDWDDAHAASRWMTYSQPYYYGNIYTPFVTLNPFHDYWSAVHCIEQPGYSPQAAMYCW